jgi:hypothetical protein
MSTRTDALVSQQETGKISASIVPIAAGCHPALVVKSFLCGLRSNGAIREPSARVQRHGVWLRRTKNFVVSAVASHLRPTAIMNAGGHLGASRGAANHLARSLPPARDAHQQRKVCGCGRPRASLSEARRYSYEVVFLLFTPPCLWRWNSACAARANALPGVFLGQLSQAALGI